MIMQGDSIQKTKSALMFKSNILLLFLLNLHVAVPDKAIRLVRRTEGMIPKENLAKF